MVAAPQHAAFSLIASRNALRSRSRMLANGRVAGVPL
jgi:hypothetical protein